MARSLTRRTALFAALALGFVAGAAFHLAALASATPDPTSSPLRHGVFVGINLLCAVGLVVRPRGFVALFALLTLQQLASHGALALRVWRDQHRVDGPSVLVLLAMPAILALLIRDRRKALGENSPGRVDNAQPPSS